MNPALTHIYETLDNIRKDIQKDIIGQDTLIEKLLITLFSGGHALIEGVPGLGKTKTVRTLATTLGYDSKRISFTPDLLPSDLTGSEIYRPQTGKFEVRKGPIFTHILLADEINRTPPKVQSALLEAMEERQVTLGDTSLALPSPFFVIATQNPLEHEGTYPLPEAQLDRFTMKIVLDYPSRGDEQKIFEASVQKNTDKKSKAEKITESDLLDMIDYISKNIHIDTKIYEYVGSLLAESRSRATGVDAILNYGASTRAGLALIRCGKVRALLAGRDYVLPEDIKYLAHDILRHRLGLSYSAMSEQISTDQVITEILETVKVL